MPNHTLADAFLSQFPKGVNPLVDILKGFTGIMEKDAEQQKQKNAQAPQAPPTPPPPPQALQAPQQQAQPDIQSLRSQIGPLLAKLGIPVGAAIAGSVNPNLLPQAAGLSQGFTREVTRQAEQQIKQDKITERKSESKRKEEKRDRKDIREQAERAIDKSKQFFPVPAERARAVKRLEEDMLRASGLGPGAAAVSARKTIEGAVLSVFPSEAAARKAGKKAGDRVNIKGVDGTLD